MNSGPTGLAEQILRQLGQLCFKNLFLITAALLLVDLAVPDVIPLIDEILLGVLATTRAEHNRHRLGRDHRAVNLKAPSPVW